MKRKRIKISPSESEILLNKGEVLLQHAKYRLSEEEEIDVYCDGRFVCMGMLVYYNKEYILYKLPERLSDSEENG